MGSCLPLGDSVEKFNALSVSLPPGPKNSRLARCYEKFGALMQRLGLEHRPTCSKNHLKPALAAGLIEMIDPALPCTQYISTGELLAPAFQKAMIDWLIDALYIDEISMYLM